MTEKKKSFNFDSLLKKEFTRKQFLGLGVVAAASAFGITRIVKDIHGYAATLAASPTFETASGVLSGGAVIVADSSASNGSAVNYMAQNGGGTQPTGPGISRIQDLSGSTLTSKLNTTSNQVSFASDTYTWNDFAYPASQTTNENHGRGVNMTTATAILGSGINQTIFQMNPGSTEKSADMTADTIDLHYFYLGPQVTLVQDCTLQGVSIGDLSKLKNGSNSTNGSGDAAKDSPYVYNGFYQYHGSGITFRRVKTVNVPGSDHVNPGESMHHCITAGPSTWEDCEVDGAQTAGTGFGANSCTGPLVYTRCYAHDVKWSCGWAIYKCSGAITLTDCKSLSNRFAWNFELNYKCTINFVRPILDSSGSGDFFFGTNYKVGNDVSSIVTIADPVDENGNAVTSIRIKVPSNYGTLADKVTPAPNLQNRSDIHVTRNGVDVTSSVVRWV